MIVSVANKDKAYFLPLEYYNLDEEDLDPLELLNKYKNKDSDSV